MTDLCEYNADAHRAAFDDEPPHAEATWIVGAEGQWRLCEACAQLPEFRRYRVRKRIERKERT